MSIKALHHVQLAMPRGGEAAARQFYDGCLGLSEVVKPPHLAVRGGCWFERGKVRVHLGVEADFKPARKAHPAFVVADVRRLAATLGRAGCRVVEDKPLEGYDRIYVDDPFGNRIEFLEHLVPVGQHASQPREAGALSGRISLTPAFFEPLPADQLDGWTGETDVDAASENGALAAHVMTFSLHPQLAADTLFLADLGLSRLLLMNDARYPWLILVPRRPDLVEITDLEAADRGMLIEEIALGSSALQDATGAAKLNIGAIGNKVSQLHIHIVGRFETDAAWPEPIWGRGICIPYGEAAARQCATAILTALGLL